MQARLDTNAIAYLRRLRLEYGLVFGLLIFVVGRAFTWDWAGAAALAANADHRIYMDAAERILAGGPFYPSWQLAGPYTLAQLPELYPPPTMALLIIPMSLLPDVLWWAVPLGIVAVMVVYWRPTAWAWAGILACFVPPWAWDGIAAGGLFMWVAAAVAVGTRWPALSVLAILKPSLFPFALLGVESRSWWILLGVVALASATFLPLWVDYVQVLANLRGETLLYSVHNIPLVLVPVLAYFGTSRLETSRRPSA